MRAREPDTEGFVDRDGVKLGYEVFGGGPLTLLLLPTWTIVHSRFWKAQVPYQSRHAQVVTFDGPGNGRSDRPLDAGRTRSRRLPRPRWTCLTRSAWTGPCSSRCRRARMRRCT